MYISPAPEGSNHAGRRASPKARRRGRRTRACARKPFLGARASRPHRAEGPNDTPLRLPPPASGRKPEPRGPVGVSRGKTTRPADAGRRSEAFPGIAGVPPASGRRPERHPPQAAPARKLLQVDAERAPAHVGGVVHFQDHVRKGVPVHVDGRPGQPHAVRVQVQHLVGLHQPALAARGVHLSQQVTPDVADDSRAAHHLELSGHLHELAGRLLVLDGGGLAHLPRRLGRVRWLVADLHGARELVDALVRGRRLPGS